MGGEPRSGADEAVPFARATTRGAGTRILNATRRLGHAVPQSSWEGEILRLIGTVIAIALLVAACGGEAPSDTAAPDLRALGRLATLADLVGPWQREPFIVDGNVRAAAERACRADPGFPPGLQLVGIDARGAGRLITAFAGPGGATAECSYTKIAPDGSITGSLSSSSTSEWAPLAPGHLAPNGGGGFSDEGDVATVQYVTGRVGAGTDRVVLEVEDVGLVTATLGNGWYLAWWESGRLRPRNAPGPHIPMKRFTVVAYDASGQITDQLQAE